MKKIIEYTIVSAPDEQKLAFNVMEAVKKGWQPYGSLAIVSVPRVISFNQALVKYEE